MHAEDSLGRRKLQRRTTSTIAKIKFHKVGILVFKDIYIYIHIGWSETSKRLRSLVKNKLSSYVYL